jgi:hypothetical protein
MFPRLCTLAHTLGHRCRVRLLADVSYVGCVDLNRFLCRRSAVVKLSGKNVSGFSYANGSIMINTYTGWWYTYPSEKYEFVSWDDDIPN